MHLFYSEWVYSWVMVPFRILKLLFRLWLRSRGLQGTLIRLAGSRLVDRILKNYQSNVENNSDISEQDARDNGRKANRMTSDTIPSAKRGMQVGLFMLGVLMVISLLVLVTVLWVN